MRVATQRKSTCGGSDNRESRWSNQEQQRVIIEYKGEDTKEEKNDLAVWCFRQILSSRNQNTHTLRHKVYWLCRCGSLLLPSISLTATQVTVRSEKGFLSTRSEEAADMYYMLCVAAVVIVCTKVYHGIVRIVFGTLYILCVWEFRLFLCVSCSVGGRPDIGDYYGGCCW